MPTLNDLISPSQVQTLNATIEELPSDDIPKLAGQKPPSRVLQRERPIHRIMLEYAAKGYGPEEIAQATGTVRGTVINALRQEHAQELLPKEIRRNHSVDEEVCEIIKRNVIKSVEVLERALDGDKITRDQREAAESFLNRRYGKPNQPVNRDSGVDLNALSIAEIAKSLPPTKGTK